MRNLLEFFRTRTETPVEKLAFLREPLVPRVRAHSPDTLVRKSNVSEIVEDATRRSVTHHALAVGGMFGDGDNDNVGDEPGSGALAWGAGLTGIGVPLFALVNYGVTSGHIIGLTLGVGIGIYTLPAAMIGIGIYSFYKGLHS